MFLFHKTVSQSGAKRFDLGGCILPGAGLVFAACLDEKHYLIKILFYVKEYQWEKSCHHY
jgi:hypothetical protein